MNIKEIQNLIKFVAKSGVSEVKIETKETKIAIKTYLKQKDKTTILPTVQQPKSASITLPKEELENKEESINEKNDNLITIKSPIIGTFYRKSSPDKPSFVEVGQTIKEGDVLCVIEAMKLFNEIESEYSGKIVKILAENASPVEFDQPLFLIEV